jgi:DNA-binding CsgD family transcriptional regulator
MESTIEVNGWRGQLGKGLAPRELEATLLAAGDMTIKQIAKRMGISPDTAKDRLDDARYKLGMQRSIRGLALEAYRRGIIAPLALSLLIGAGHQEAPVLRRPFTPRSYVQLRIARKVEDMHLAA